MVVCLVRPASEEEDVAVAADHELGPRPAGRATTLGEALHGPRALQVAGIAARIFQHIGEGEIIPAYPHGDHGDVLLDSGVPEHGI